MLKPKLISLIKNKNYSLSQFAADCNAGIIVGIVALPLAIAFAIASGVSPEKGLITAIVGGFIVSVLGGSRVQIAGPTGAFVVIVYGIVQHFGLQGLYTSTFLAGILLVILGLFRLGSFISFMPHPVIVGFTSGIAVIIFSSQVKDFLGLKMGVINPWAVVISLGTIVLITQWRKFNKQIPGPLVALCLLTVIAHILSLPVETIGSRFGEIPHHFPLPVMPPLSMEAIIPLIPSILAITLLGGIESLLSAVVADGMIEGKHRSNMEFVAQGIANIASPLFGGIPVTGAIARTATNVSSGGRTPIAGIVHAIFLLLVMLFLGKLVVYIPLACLAGILVVVSYHMSEWKSFIKIFKHSRNDMIVLCATFLLTVMVDLITGIIVGVMLSVILKYLESKQR